MADTEVAALNKISKKEMLGFDYLLQSLEWIKLKLIVYLINK